MEEEKNVKSAWTIEVRLRAHSFCCSLSTTVGLSVRGRIGRIFATSFARSLGVARSEFRRTSFIFARMKDSGGIFSSAM